jgi:hypothetical protein
MTFERIELRVMLTESQAEKVQERLKALPFRVNYLEEQHGASLVACIACTQSQEKSVRDLLRDVGAALAPDHI